MARSISVSKEGTSLVLQQAERDLVPPVSHLGCWGPHSPALILGGGRFRTPSTLPWLLLGSGDGDLTLICGFRTSCDMKYRPGLGQCCLRWVRPFLGSGRAGPTGVCMYTPYA